MKAIARARYVKVPPRKARYIADLIRGKTVNQALSILMTVPRNASRIIEKTLDSAVANAIVKAEGERLDVDELVVPVVDIAKSIGNVRAATIVALASFVARSGVVDLDRLRACVKAEFAQKEKLIPINMKAIEAGLKAAQAA